MCKVLKVNRSSYYKWLKGGISKRKYENQILTNEITKIFHMSKQTYGSPRITRALAKQGFMK